MVSPNQEDGRHDGPNGVLPGHRVDEQSVISEITGARSLEEASSAGNMTLEGGEGEGEEEVRLGNKKGGGGRGCW